MLLADAANDHFFVINTSNSQVIKSSLVSLAGFPKTLKIYRIFGSKFWQVRIYLNGKYISKSLRTLDFSEATRLAQEFFADVKLKHPREILAVTHPQNNKEIIAKGIESIIAVDLDRVRRDEIKHSSSLIMKGRLEGEIYEFFKSQDVKSISTQTLQNFIDTLTDQGFSTTTIQGYLSLVNKLLRFLYTEKYLQQIPLVPRIKAQNNSRGAFTLTEYVLILRQSRSLRHTKFSDWQAGKRIWIKEQYQTMPFEMNWLIRFVIYTFIRPGDIRQSIRHSLSD